MQEEGYGGRGSLPQVQHLHAHPFPAREQFGFGHMACNGMGRIVKGQLVAEAPRKDTKAQQRQPKGKGAHASPATDSGKLSC